VSFGALDCFLLFVVVGARNKLGSSLLTLVVTPLKANTQFIYGFGCTLLNPDSSHPQSFSHSQQFSQDTKLDMQPPALARYSLW
jgi:hypothetical protein